MAMDCRVILRGDILHHLEEKGKRRFAHGVLHRVSSQISVNFTLHCGHFVSN